ncbi:conserved hypothetical protein [Rhodospirillaceae bacterium LM-1]|nr:conserved hypothetical protein [Rhodospirillaceae bacterium LM-1]
MSFPDFFDQAPQITMRDPLSEFLGASEGGLITYAYADAVKLAGHSCPTVAGTWLMLARGLECLYPNSSPERGRIRIGFPDPANSGVTGVMAAVATLVTGATQDNGFKGLGGRFDRRGLLDFSQPINGSMALERCDTSARVTLSLDTSVLPAAPEMGALMGLCLSGQGAKEDQKRFGQMWQSRVRHMLTVLASDARLVRLTTA